MSADPIQSLRKTSIDVESLLPAYEQHQSTGVETKISPPEETATADDIRVFLTQLLISERGLFPDHAHDIASRWKTGNGKELRTYPAAMYLDIFGREDGWVVYRETKLCLARDKKTKVTPLHCHSGTVVSAHDDKTQQANELTLPQANTKLTLLQASSWPSTWPLWSVWSTAFSGEYTKTMGQWPWVPSLCLGACFL